jgi:Skp family chaperone for outer membrane proteins
VSSLVEAGKKEDDPNFDVAFPEVLPNSFSSSALAQVEKQTAISVTTLNNYFTGVAQELTDMATQLLDSRKKLQEKERRISELRQALHQQQQ